MPLALFSSRVLRNSDSSRRSLRRAAGLGLGFLSLLSISAAHAGTVNWDGAVADWFSNPAHWVGGNYPGAGDDAVNSSTAAMTLGQDTTVNSFFSKGAFSLQGGTFSGSQANSLSTITVNDVFAVNGGIINNFTVKQGAGGSLVFNASSANGLDNSIINSSMDFVTNAGAYTNIFDAVTANGNINMGVGSNIRLTYGGASLTLGTNSHLTGAGTVSEYQGTTLTNNGTINANSNGNALNLNVTQFNNSGTAEATSGGTLGFNSANVANNGTIAAKGAGSVAALTGTITNGAGSLFTAANGGQIQVNGATLAGTINTDASTALVFNAASNNYISDGAVINGNLDLATVTDAYTNTLGAVTENGNINLASGSDLRLTYGGASLTLGSTGSITGAGSVSEYQGTTLINNGTINANVSGSPLVLQVTQFNTSGTTEATKGGVLDLNNTNTVNSGTLAAKSGGIVNITGTLTENAGSSMDGAGGTFNVNGATLAGTLNQTTGTALVFNAASNNYISDGTIINGGSLDLATVTDAYTNTLGAVTENGNINLASGSDLRLTYGGASLTLGSAGSITGAGAVSEFQGTTLNNNGTINADSNGNTLAISNTAFNNAGTAEATNGGILTLAGNTTTTNTGTLAATGGGVLDISGTLNSNAGSSINGAGGTVNIQGANLLGTINGVGATELVFNASSGNQINNNNGNNSTTVNANLDLATQPSAYLDTFGAVTENGTINLGASSHLRLVYGGASLTLGSAGSITGSGGVSEYQGTTLTNNGTINANSSSSPFTLAVTSFNNNSTTEATNGAMLNLNNTNTNANDGSTLAAVGKGSVVSIMGTYTGTGSDLVTATNGGQIQVNGATLAGTLNETTGTALVFNASSANNISDGAVINGDLDLATVASAHANTFGAVTENGNLNLGNGGGLQITYGGASLTLGSAGSLTGFGAVSEYQGTTLANNGTINANVSGQALNLNTTAFTNTGTTEVQNGAALNVTSANTDSGNVLVKTGGTATFTQGLTQTAGLTQADGTLNSPLTLTGGTLAGTGTVNGNVTNTSATDTGGTVSAGNSASPFGTLTVNGSFAQQAGGALDVGFSSTQNNLLNVMGAVTTGGVLDVNYLGSGPYTGSGPFTFLDYTTLMTSIASTGPTQYFSNETFLTDGTGVIDGSNGFTYELLNNTANNGLQLEVLNNGAPVPAVPEASTTISLGLLLLLGGAGLWRAKRRTAHAAD